MSAADLREYAPQLQPGSTGWWTSAAVSDVSYPAEGNALCFAVEDASFWFEHRNRCIVEAMKLFPPSGMLFDVGGGNGCVARAIQDAGFEVALVEPGLAGVENAARRGLRHVVRSTLQDAGFLPGTLPAIGLFDVLEHIDGDRAFLAIANDLLTPGGRIYITVPAYQLLWSHEDVAAGHARRYSIRALTDVLRKAGYAVEFASYFFSFLPFPILLRRALPYRLGLGSKSNSEAALRSDHEVRNPALRRLLARMSRRELSRIAKQQRIRFGGSCLAIAQKR